MSLIVYAYRRDAEGKWHDLPGAGSDLAGPEVWRHEVYGSPIARELGIELLATLASGNISAEGEDLQRLRREAEILRFAADRFGARAETLRARLANLRAAIDLAEAGGGAVYIG